MMGLRLVLRMPWAQLAPRLMHRSMIRECDPGVHFAFSVAGADRWEHLYICLIHEIRGLF